MCIKKENGKTCTKCCVWKEYSEFPKDRNSKDGCVSRCKSCKYDYNKDYFSRSEVKQQQKEYYAERNTLSEVVEENKRRHLEYRNRPENKAKLREYDKEYSNRPEVVEKNKQRFIDLLDNPEVYNLYLERRRKSYDKFKQNLLDERLAKGIRYGDIILYVLKFRCNTRQEVFFKIGVTEVSVGNRYSSGYNNYEYEVLQELYFDKDYCYALEQKLLYEHRKLGLQYKFPEHEKFCGYTECFIALDEEILSKYLP